MTMQLIKFMGIAGLAVLGLLSLGTGISLAFIAVAVIAGATMLILA